MNFVFFLFLRLFICFVAAKLVVQAVDLDSRGYLLGLTAVLLINVYLFDYLVYRQRSSPPSNPPEATPEEPPAPDQS